jgi:hypothetical protein
VTRPVVVEGARRVLALELPALVTAYRVPVLDRDGYLGHLEYSPSGAFTWRDGRIAEVWTLGGTRPRLVAEVLG